jgi:DNA-binding NarL/FixJ family response regulator
VSSTGTRRVCGVAEAKTELGRIAAQLEDLKRLTIMQLLVSGAQSTHIAKVLKIDPGTISKMMPVREIQSHVGRRSQDTD